MCFAIERTEDNCLRCSVIPLSCYMTLLSFAFCFLWHASHITCLHNFKKYASLWFSAFSFLFVSDHLWFPPTDTIPKNVVVWPLDSVPAIPLVYGLLHLSSQEKLSHWLQFLPIGKFHNYMTRISFFIFFILKSLPSLFFLTSDR